MVSKYHDSNQEEEEGTKAEAEQHQYNSIMEWLNLFLSYNTGASSTYNNRWLLDIDSILEAVIRYPTSWAMSLLQTYSGTFPAQELNIRVIKLSNDLSQQLKAAANNSSNSAALTSTADIERDVETYKRRLRSLKDSSGREGFEPSQSKGTAWPLVESWDPRPIGVL